MLPQQRTDQIPDDVPRLTPAEKANQQNQQARLNGKTMPTYPQPVQRR